MSELRSDISQVAVVTSEADFDHLHEAWDKLLEESDQGVFFLRWRWNRLWWGTYAPPHSQLLLIACRDKCGELLGLAPLYLRPRLIAGITYLREVLFLGTGVNIKTSEYLDVIARRGQEQAVGESVVRLLRENADWDRLCLWGMPASSAVANHIVRVLGTAAQVEICDRSHYIDTRSDWDTYERELSKSHRQNINYYTRKLFKTHECQLRRIGTADELESGMDSLTRLHQARWTSKGQSGSFKLPGMETLLKEAMRQSLREGRLRFWILEVDGQAAAALVGFFHKGVVHYFQSGFDPAYAKNSLGTVMLRLCIQDCFNEESVNEFDFMGGSAPYKDRWTNWGRDSIQVDLLRPGLRSFFFSSSQQAWHAARRIVRGSVQLPRFRRR